MFELQNPEGMGPSFLRQPTIPGAHLAVKGSQSREATENLILNERSPEFFENRQSLRTDNGCRFAGEVGLAAQGEPSQPQGACASEARDFLI